MNHSLQKQAQLLLCGGFLATEDLVGLRYAREDVENKHKEISLGVGRAVIEGLGGIHSGSNAQTIRKAFLVSEQASPRKGVIFEQNIQKLTNHQHRIFFCVRIFGVFLKSSLKSKVNNIVYAKQLKSSKEVAT